MDESAMMLLAQQVDAARAAGALMGFLCAMGVILVVVTLIGAAILMGACALFNKMVYKPASKNGIPMPNMGKAMGIIFATTLVNLMLVLAIGFAVGAGTTVVGGDTKSVGLIVQLVANVASYLVLAGLLSLMLPTSFGRALLVALLYFAFGLIITAVILLVVVASFGGLPAGPGLG